MTIKSSISLTDEQYAFAKALVEAGRFSSVSAVLQQGVDLLRQRIDDDELDRRALRKILEPRLNGPFISGAQMDERIAALIEAKRRAHGIED